jgi:hypothetical protein
MNLTKKILGSAKRSYITWRNSPPILDRVRRTSFEKKSSRKILTTPTQEETLAINTLRTGISALPQEGITGTSSERKWRMFKTRLRTDVQNRDPRTFLSWEVIRPNMLYASASYEYSKLMSSPRWPMIRQAIAEKESINQLPYFLNPEASENNVKQAYHLEQFMVHSGRSIKDLDLIIDFGGGYGSMCKVAHGLGFNGRYVIFDWPEFSLLQEFYLKLSSTSQTVLRTPSEENGIYLINDPEKLHEFFERPCRSLLIATWSMSEMPVVLREKLLTIVSPSYFLITYQKKFGEINNEAYFDKLMSNRTDIKWSKFPMKYIPLEKNKYLIGIRK